MAPKRTNLKDLDEQLGTLASQIANHEFLTLGINALGDSPVPKLHKYFIASAPDSTKLSIQIKIKTLLDSENPKRIDRKALLASIQAEKQNLLDKFERLCEVRNRMQTEISELQVAAIKENAAKMMQGARKDYMKKMGIKYGVCHQLHKPN